MFELLRPDIKNALKNKTVKKILPRYVKVAEDKLPANFQIAKRIVFDFDKSLTTVQLWKEHEKLMKKFYEIKAVIDKKKLKIEELEIPRFSLLDLKIMLTKEIMKSCELCERKCQINRLEGMTGICGVGREMRICSISRHLGEEACVSPSLTVFFSRCNWRCVYCQNWDISQGHDRGIPMLPEKLAEIIDSWRKKGEVRNLNLVGGSPTPYLQKILETIKFCEVNIPVIFNSNAYCSEKTMKLLDGLIDLFLFDFRYFDDNCALRLSKVPNCREVLCRNHSLARKQAESLIRVLVLPNHLECCDKPILKWIKENLGNSVLVNLMNQFHPTFRAREYPEINRRLEPDEFEKIVRYAKSLKLSFIT
jgi:putative pyruvate formate lyase activating enzyme